jgi:ribosomal protein S18 acetylase RimI-like enzyme
MDELSSRHDASMRHFYAIMGRGSEGARLVEAPGAQGTVVPAAPRRSYPNAVLYDDAAALEAAYDELAAAYDEAGIAAWTVWVPQGDGAGAFLEARGHALDATPTAMGRRLDGHERPPKRALERWTGEGDTRVVARLNELAYGFTDPRESFAGAFATLAADDLFAYVGWAGGEPVTCLMTSETGGNCDIEGVATHPAFRGRGLAGELLAHALADAAERGCDTTTLVATALGKPVYDRLGYRALGTLEMWERRTSP